MDSAIRENINRAFAQRSGIDALQHASLLADTLETVIAPDHNGDNRERILALSKELRWLVGFRQQRQARGGKK